jgi:hypothetical protein
MVRLDSIEAGTWFAGNSKSGKETKIRLNCVTCRFGNSTPYITMENRGFAEKVFLYVKNMRLVKQHNKRNPGHDACLQMQPAGQDERNL